MVRIIVSLPEKDKKWLEQTGRRRGISAAEVVRRAVACLRDSEPSSDFRQTIAACAGQWKAVKADSQALVDSWRNDWDRGR